MSLSKNVHDEFENLLLADTAAATPPQPPKEPHMFNEKHNALAAAREQRGDHRAHRAHALTRVEGSGPDTMIWLGIRKIDLEAAKPGTGQHRGIGLSVDAEVTVPAEGTFVLTANWLRITAI